jgi:hypothetical protein
MTISEIIQRIRIEANDDGATKLRKDAYYTSLIIAAIGDLESFMGRLSIREDSFQFLPMRDQVSKSILYEEDGVTPQIDASIFLNDDADIANSPVDIFVNKGLRVATGKATGRIQSADFVDDYGITLEEPDIAFIKIDADVTGTVTIDVSLDNRESWVIADHGIEMALENGTTGYVDVSRIPSSFVALKWQLTGDTALVRNTTFWRLYIPRDRLRHYAADIIELVKLRLLEIRIDRAISNGNTDPVVISGMQYQATEIRKKYGLHKNSGDTKPMSQGGAVQCYPVTREEGKVFGFTQSSGDFLTERRIIGVTSTGQLRRV